MSKNLLSFPYISLLGASQLASSLGLCRESHYSDFCLDCCSWHLARPNLPLVVKVPPHLLVHATWSSIALTAFMIPNLVAKVPTVMSGPQRKAISEQ